MRIIEVIAGLLMEVGALFALALMAVGVVMYYIPGKFAKGQSLMRTGAMVAFWTIGLGGATATIIEASADWEWRGVVHFALIIALTCIVFWLAKRFRVRKPLKPLPGKAAPHRSPGMDENVK
jgi:hypothetical protein